MFRFLGVIAGCCFVLIQVASATSIGVNFATDGTWANFDLTPTDSTCVISQQHWNNAHNADPSLTNLIDDSGNATGASIAWQHSPVSTNVAGGTPIGNLLHSGISTVPFDSI